MGKRKKKKRIMDHRNEGFIAREALFEHNEEKAQLINRQIVTKNGLNDYTEEEIMAKAGEVTTYNYNNRYTWKEFKAMPDTNKREYIAYLKQKYDGLRIKDLAEMFDVSFNCANAAIAKLKLSFPRGGAKNTAGRVRFREEMLNSAEPVPVETHESIPSASKFDVLKLQVVCDAGQASEVLYNFGVTGRIRITAEVIDGKEVV